MLKALILIELLGFGGGGWSTILVALVCGVFVCELVAFALLPLSVTRNLNRC